MRAHQQRLDPEADFHLDRTAQAYSIAFQLPSMVEENAQAQYRRVTETHPEYEQESGLWRRILISLKEAGLTGEQIANQLPYLWVEPVLTAHPTDAKRPTVLDHHREFYLLLLRRENQMRTPSEQERIRQESSRSSSDSGVPVRSTLKNQDLSRNSIISCTTYVTSSPIYCLPWINVSVKLGERLGLIQPCWTIPITFRG